jgi:hypothetical protein
VPGLENEVIVARRLHPPAQFAAAGTGAHAMPV